MTLNNKAAGKNNNITSISKPPKIVISKNIPKIVPQISPTG
jgi:hypothetical protein